MSIIKPGDIRVDVLGISKIKQQGGRWRVRRVGEKKNRKKKKTNFQVIFGNETEGEQKKPPKKQSQEGGMCLIFRKWHPFLWFCYFTLCLVGIYLWNIQLDWYLFLCTRLF